MRMLLLALCLALTACSTTKILQPVDGSKADGTVTLSYDYGLLEKPVVDWSLANSAAKARCAAWGYKGAQMFGGEQTSCTAYNHEGTCIRERVNVVYQCTN